VPEPPTNTDDSARAGAGGPDDGRRGRAPVVFDAFRHRVFLRLWTAGFVSQMGDWMQIFGRSALAFEITGSAADVGIVYFATYLPQLLFSLVGGVMADRFDRKRLFIWTQVAQACFALLLGALVVTGNATLLTLTLLSFLSGTANMLSQPPAQALLPSVVPRADLTSAISLIAATGSMTRVLGPLVAAVIIPILGVQWLFWINGLSFFAVIFTWGFTKVKRQPSMGDITGIQAMREGIRYVRGNPAVGVPIGVSAFLGTIGVVYQPISIAFATTVLAHGVNSTGVTYNAWIQAAIGLGAAFGVLVLAGLGRRRPAFTLMAAAIGFSVALILYGSTQMVAVAVVVALFLGAFQFGGVALSLNLVQHEVPEVMRGRVMSIQWTGLVGGVPIAALIGGGLAGWIGIQQVIAGSGVVCLVFSLVALRWRKYVRTSPIDHETPETVVALTVLEEEG
jgi:MFS family permease